MIPKFLIRGFSSNNEILFGIESRYGNHLNFGLVQYSNGRFVSGCQIVRFLNGGPKTGLKKSSLNCNVWSSFCSFSYSRLCCAAVAFFYKREGGKWAGKVKLKEKEIRRSAFFHFASILCSRKL